MYRMVFFCVGLLGASAALGDNCTVRGGNSNGGAGGDNRLDGSGPAITGAGGPGGVNIAVGCFLNNNVVTLGHVTCGQGAPMGVAGTAVAMAMMRRQVA